MEEELKQYLRKSTCRGCFNHCSLDNPSCGRSKIFIKDAFEKYNEEKNKNGEQLKFN